MNGNKEKNPKARGIDDVIVPNGYALSGIIGAAVFSLVLFIVPLYIAVKVYLFMAACLLLAVLLYFNPWYQSALQQRFKREGDSYTIIEKVSLAVIFAAIFWSGVVKFSQYWWAGGADPYFHDMPLIYIASLVLLIVYWTLAIIVVPLEQTIVSVLRSRFREMILPAI